MPLFRVLIQFIIAACYCDAAEVFTADEMGAIRDTTWHIGARGSLCNYYSRPLPSHHRSSCWLLLGVG